MSWQMAEELAAAYLRTIGFPDAKRLPDGPDGGLDVVGARIAAQVKFLSRPVGRPAVQQTRGAAGGRIAAFFSVSGYTAEALTWAELNEVALWRYTHSADVFPENRFAQQLASNDLPSEDETAASELWGTLALRYTRTHDGSIDRMNSATTYYRARPEDFTEDTKNRLSEHVAYCARFYEYFASRINEESGDSGFPELGTLVQLDIELEAHIQWLERFWQISRSALLPPVEEYRWLDGRWVRLAHPN